VTKQEHDLMLTLFAIQMQVSGTILEILRSRGVADAGDVEPFSLLAMQDVRTVVPQFLSLYQRAARECGVELPEGFAPAS